MEIDKIKLFIEGLDDAVQESSKNAYEYFQKNWPSLDLKSKEIIRLLLSTHYIVALLSKENTLEDKIYYAGISTIADSSTNQSIEFDEEPFSKLVLNKSINKKELVKIFHKLKSNGTILSTHVEIANAMALIFDISFDTAYTYLTDSSRLENTNDLI